MKFWRQGWLLPFYRPFLIQSFPDILPKSYSYAMLFPSCGICWFMYLLLYFSLVFYLPPTLICRLHGDKSVFSANLYLEPGIGLEHSTRQLSITLINIHYSQRIWSIIHQFGNFTSGKPGYIMSRYQVYHKADNSCISPCGHIQIGILIFKFQPNHWIVK